MKKGRDITCRRCGPCGHVDVAAFVSPEDIQRWEKEGCHDIVARLRDCEVTWAGDRIINRFGTKATTCHYFNWAGSHFFCEFTRHARRYVAGMLPVCPNRVLCIVGNK